MSERHRNKQTPGTSVCIKNQAGAIRRMKKTEAAPLVEKGTYVYCPKSEWKDATRPAKKEKQTEVE